MTGNNPNVLYEVGYAYAKSKLCIPLTTDPKTIPFDLKDKPHIVFSGLNDLTTKLERELQLLKAEMEISFDRNDSQCWAEVAEYRIATTITSAATSIRARVKTGSELHLKDVSAQMIRIERRVKGERWKRLKLEQAIPLRWLDTDTILTDFPASATKYVNVFHVNHDENKLTIWRLTPMPAVLEAFLNCDATYRATVSVRERHTRLEIIWHRDWRTMVVRLAK